MKEDISEVKDLTALKGERILKPLRESLQGPLDPVLTHFLQFPQNVLDR